MGGRDGSVNSGILMEYQYLISVTFVAFSVLLILPSDAWTESAIDRP